MGLFDKLFSSNQATVSYSPKNEQEAWVSILYGCMSVDGDVSNSEIDKLVDMVMYKTLFSGHKVTDYYRTAMTMYKQIGSQGLIENSCNKVSADNKPTLFALVVELLLADGILAEKEKEIIEFVSKSLALEDSLAQKIVEVILIKMKGNVVV